MRSEFESWMKTYERKKPNTAYQYAVSIDKVSRHYSESTGEYVNLFNISDVARLRQIHSAYSKGGRFSTFGDKGNGTIRNAIATYIRYVQYLRLGKDASEAVSSSVGSKGDEIEFPDNESEFGDEALNFSYERDLQSALISEISSLFPKYKIFGNGVSGVEYAIEGKRIDVLLEDYGETELLAIELKAGRADFRVFGQISMYIGLLSKQFPDREIKGLIIAGSIDESLKNACRITDKISIKTYRMKLELENV